MIIFRNFILNIEKKTIIIKFKIIRFQYSKFLLMS